MTNVAKVSNEAQSISNTAQPKLSVRALLIENLLSAAELALDMERAVYTVYKWVQQGLPNEKINGKLYFDPKLVAQWLKARPKK
jgi:hypothetical protein